jgi:ABC-type multidrug transport system fused ATPase/permease subunit
VLFHRLTYLSLRQAIITFANHSYYAHRDGQQAPGIGKGFGLAIALVVLQVISSLAQNHFFYRGMSTGVLLRGGLITAIYSRSLHLTTRARAVLPNGRLVNHISTDVSRIDFCCGFFHMFWTAPIQMAICLGLLIDNLGPSALAGFFVFIILMPIQGKIMKSLFQTRQKTMKWTDKRAKLLQELLGGMKLIKFFAWEKPFLSRIAGYRKREMRYDWHWIRPMVITADPTIFVQLRTDDVVDSCSEYGSCYVSSCAGISRRIHRICSHWAPAVSCCHLLLIDLVPAPAIASHDAT